MPLNEQRRNEPLFCNRLVTGRLIDSILTQDLGSIGDRAGSNLDANSLLSGSVLDAIQQSCWFI